VLAIFNQMSTALLFPPGVPRSPAGPPITRAQMAKRIDDKLPKTLVIIPAKLSLQAAGTYEITQFEKGEHKVKKGNWGSVKPHPVLKQLTQGFSLDSIDGTAFIVSSSGIAIGTSTGLNSETLDKTPLFALKRSDAAKEKK